MNSTIWGDQVGIRPLRPLDAGLIRRYAMDPEVADLLFEEKGVAIPSSFALAGDILSMILGSRPNWAIVDLEGHFIGEIRLWRISERNKSAMLTVYIGERSRWGQGLGTEALRLVLRQAFRSLGLRRIELNVFDFNHRAIRSYQKVGFVLEGSRRKALSRNGQEHDILVMGILKDEFDASERGFVLGGQE